MMGSLVFDKCYTTGEAAADAFFSAREPVVTAGSTSYVTWFEKVGSVWQVKRQSISETGISTDLTATVATVPAFPSCDPSQSFNEGRDLGWQMVVVLLVAWGFVMIRRQIR